MTDWREIEPADAVDIDLSKRLDIDAPLNELGERCPWPWEPQQLIGVPLGQYHCLYCGAMVVAGMAHVDYRLTNPPGERGNLLAAEGWRYLPTGQVRHLVGLGIPGGITGDSACGLDIDGKHWRGTGSQEEYEKLADLPVCRSCMRVL